MPKPRKSSKLKPLKTLKIFCEGEKTEPNYLNGYIATLDEQARKSVVEVATTKKNTAVQLVAEAIKAKKSPSSLPDDEFWVVYDRESVVKYEDKLHAEAFSNALNGGVKVALSNVCFEFWLLLHFENTDAPYENFDDLLKRSALNDEVRKVCGRNYDKASNVLFSVIKDRIPDARQRGLQVNKRGIESAEKGKDKPYQINPYVGIVYLLQAIDEFE